MELQFEISVLGALLSSFGVCLHLRRENYFCRVLKRRTDDGPAQRAEKS